MHNKPRPRTTRQPNIRALVASKLEPIRTSGVFRAILGCLVGEPHWTTPAIAELIITSDGMLLARMDGDIGANEILGSRDDYFRNLLGVAKVAALTPRETRWLVERIG